LTSLFFKNNPFSLVFQKILKTCYIKRLSNQVTSTKKFSPGAVRISKNIFTTHAILDIVTALYENIHNNDYSRLILLDLKNFRFRLS